ncbi:MAG: histidine phosphatase family protein [Rhodospirillales bacterium]
MTGSPDTTSRFTKRLWDGPGEPVVTRWWLVRHAPVDPAMRGKLYGQMDVECITDDAASFRALADALPPDAAFVVSPLGRTRKTAAAIRGGGHPNTDHEEDPAFMEQHFGDWQGLTWDEMKARAPEAYARFWQAPADNAPPGGESCADLIRRVGAGMEAWSEKLSGRDVVLVGHAGTVRGAVSHALGLAAERSLALSVDTLSLTRLDHIQGGVLASHAHAGAAPEEHPNRAWRVVFLNHPAPDLAAWRD